MPAPLASLLGAGSAAASVAAPLMQAGGPLSPDRIKTLAADFESVFLNSVLEEMFADATEGDPFAEGEGAEAWRSIQVEEFGRAISQAGGIGLAEHVQRQLIALQENQS